MCYSTLRQCVELWRQIRHITLREEDDRIHWKFTEAGHYTAKSAYEVQFLGAFAKPR